MERAKGTLDRTMRPKHSEEIPKTFKVCLYQFIFHQICRRKPYLLNVGSRQKDTFEADFLSLKPA